MWIPSIRLVCETIVRVRFPRARRYRLKFSPEALVGDRATCIPWQGRPRVQGRHEARARRKRLGSCPSSNFHRCTTKKRNTVTREVLDWRLSLMPRSKRQLMSIVTAAPPMTVLAVFSCALFGNLSYSRRTIPLSRRKRHRRRENTKTTPNWKRGRVLIPIMFDRMIVSYSPATTHAQTCVCA